MDSVLARVQHLDESLYRDVASTSTPALDGPVRGLSVAANWSRLSMAAAAVLAVAGGPRGRRAAVYGLGCVAVASVAANVGGKLATRRQRPDRDGLGVDPARVVAMPTSSSFPSGHSASAFAFASGVRHVWPAASIPCYVLAAAVAYSRVHTGVHYPGDVAAGTALGLGTAAVTCALLDHVPALQPSRDTSLPGVAVPRVLAQDDADPPAGVACAVLQDTGERTGLARVSRRLPGRLRSRARSLLEGRSPVELSTSFRADVHVRGLTGAEASVTAWIAICRSGAPAVTT